MASPKNNPEIYDGTLLLTNVAPSNGTFEDDGSFSKGGIC